LHANLFFVFIQQTIASKDECSLLLEDAAIAFVTCICVGVMYNLSFLLHCRLETEIRGNIQLYHMTFF